MNGTLMVRSVACALFMVQSHSMPSSAEVITRMLNGLEISIDKRSGGIVRLASSSVGVFLDTPPAFAAGVELAYPIPEFVALRLATRFSTARIQEETDAIVIDWDPLGPSRSNFELPEGRIHGRMRIAAAPDGRSVVLTCQIENKTAALVPQILFPDLHGLRPVHGPAATQLRFPGGAPILPFQEDAIPPDTAPFYVGSGWREYPPSTGIYGLNSLRWLDFGGYMGGLSIFQKAWGRGERPTVRTYRSQADSASLRLMWDYRTGVKPGATWDSDEVWLTPHTHGWARGIEVFRDYVRGQHSRRKLPPHVRDGIGFQTIWVMQAPEKDPAHVAFRWEDLPRVAADAKAHGINEIVIWGWCDYFTLPFTLRTEAGSMEEFLDAVRQAGEMGVTLSPFVSCYTMQNRHAQRYGREPGPSAWAYHPDLVPMMDPYYLGPGYPVRFWSGGVFTIEPHHPNYQTDVQAAFKEWIDKGVVNWCWDQVYADPSTPESPGLTDLLAAVRELARTRNPEAVFSGEQVSSLELDHGVLDYTWNWLDYTDSTPITQLLPSPRLNCNVEDSPRVVKMGFADNLFLNVMPRKPDQPNGTAMISDRPALAAALKEVAGLRKRFLPYFVDGIPLGDSILAQASPAFVRAYQYRIDEPGKQLAPLPNDRLLIVVLNHQPAPGSFTINCSLTPWLASASSYRIRAYSPEKPDDQPYTVKMTDPVTLRTELKPLEFTFFEIEAALSGG